MSEQSLISPEVLARYAADAAREVSGVAGLAESPMHRDRPIEISGPSGATGITVHVQLEWGRSAAEVARGVQRRVAEYLERMAKLTIASVDVVIIGVGPPPAKQ